MLCRISNGLVELSVEYRPVPCCQPASHGHSKQFQTSTSSLRLMPSNMHSFQDHHSLECPSMWSRWGRFTGSIQTALKLASLMSTMTFIAVCTLCKIIMYYVHYVPFPQFRLLIAKLLISVQTHRTQDTLAPSRWVWNVWTVRHWLCSVHATLWHQCRTVCR